MGKKLLHQVWPENNVSFWGAHSHPFFDIFSVDFFLIHPDFNHETFLGLSGRCSFSVPTALRSVLSTTAGEHMERKPKDVQEETGKEEGMSQGGIGARVVIFIPTTSSPWLWSAEPHRKVLHHGWGCSGTSPVLFYLQRQYISQRGRHACLVTWSDLSKLNPYYVLIFFSFFIFCLVVEDLPATCKGLHSAPSYKLTN